MLCLCLSSILVSFLYIRIIGCVGRVMVFLSILFVYVFGIFLSYILIADGSGRMEDEETYRYGMYELIAGVF